MTKSTSQELQGLKNFAEQFRADLQARVQARCDHHFVPLCKNRTAHIGPVVCERCDLVRYDTLPSPRR